MQGLLIYVLIYFVGYSMNAMNAGAECRYGMTKQTNVSLVWKSGCKKNNKILFLLAIITSFISVFWILFIS